MVKTTAVPKRFGEALDVRVAVVPNNMPISTFLAQAGTNCKCLERFVDKETVYFTGAIDESKRQKLRIRDRPNFRVELRDSPVLILSMKGRAQLTIDEVREIIQLSSLREKLHLIQMIAVGGQTNAKSRHVAHAYLQFADSETARSCVNSVDALPYKGGHVHSPQIDIQSLQESMQGRAVVWSNPAYNPNLNASLNSLPSIVTSSPPLSPESSMACMVASAGSSVTEEAVEGLSSTVSDISGEMASDRLEMSDYYLPEAASCGLSTYDDEMLAAFY